VAVLESNLVMYVTKRGPQVVQDATEMDIPLDSKTAHAAYVMEGPELSVTGVTEREQRNAYHAMVKEQNGKLNK